MVDAGLDPEESETGGVDALTEPVAVELVDIVGSTAAVSGFQLDTESAVLGVSLLGALIAGAGAGGAMGYDGFATGLSPMFIK